MIRTPKWHTRLTDAMINRYVADGKWTNVTLAESALSCAREHPERVAVVDGNRRITFGEIYERASRLAHAFRRLGLNPGDVVSFQLPNWNEAIEINMAAAISGIIVNPIIPIYRDAEVSFILRDACSRMVFIPESFRGFDYSEMLRRIGRGLPGLEHVIVVRPNAPREDSYDSLLERAPLDEHTFPAVSANSIKLLLYTSGTTGEPKGVLHSHNTLRSDLDATIRFRDLKSSDVVLMPSPVTHVTGYLYGLELPFVLGITVVLMDRWDPPSAIRLMEEFKVTLGNGATPFLAELVSQLEGGGQRLPSLRLFATGGAPVPPELVRRAVNLLPNCRIFRAYGCSEAPTISLGLAHGDPPDLGIYTDGMVYNHEVRIVDIASGENVLPGRPGEILTRGPEVMLGYTSAAHTASAFDEEGFFRTGDIGVLDNNGYITITGRKKDLIIRGGENLSPKEIEDVLHQHSSVQEVAVIGMPHPRMGETPCACVVLKPNTSFDFDTMIRFLEGAGLARQKYPERLVIFDEFPRNAAGKILKHQLKVMVDHNETPANVRGRP